MISNQIRITIDVLTPIIDVEVSVAGCSVVKSIGIVIDDSISN
jgi:hypothetical protein